MSRARLRAAIEAVAELAQNNACACDRTGEVAHNHRRGCWVKMAAADFRLPDDPASPEGRLWSRIVDAIRAANPNWHPLGRPDANSAATFHPSPPQDTMTRHTVDLAQLSPPFPTPWGPATLATVYAPGLTFYETAGHGGFHVAQDLLASMPEPYRSHPTYCGQAGWYEEDCDWAAVALSFPSLFTPQALDSARAIWTWLQSRKAPQP